MTASLSRFGSYDKVVVVVPRAEVEGVVDSRTELYLLSLVKSPEDIAEFFDQIAVFFEGYDADVRKLWMIPEVCTFARRLDEVFPQWGFFFSIRGGSVAAMANCLIGPDVHTTLPALYIQKLLGQVIENAFVQIGMMADQAGFSDEQLHARLRNVSLDVLGVELNL